MADHVLLDIDGRGVATITLDRPERLNAIDLDMRDLLWSYVDALDDMAGMAALVFKGNGSSFCAGADIGDFGTAPGLMAARQARHDRDIWWRLLRLPFPSIAAMHGHCYGAGLELSLCCDVRVAEEGALFAVPEVKLGYMPSAGGTQTLPRTMPPGVATHLVLTGDAIGTDAALRWGLVDRVVVPGGLDRAVEEEVMTAIAAPEEAMARRRAMVNR